ncbi:hypothetical protein [Alcaligenes endophyticus]|uniref:Uncharacterized protein n=1 Tax=Alcaligenes endophyticus TaxID=1929088 RepID=A0ABT8EH21_9BURK|nr:hypothetical protein [Alcaligenes endophyticus]MCX5589754.1 hypothetical protein [Alcaligenes endophyticus]MDN4120582.1 hypothetical protein [Alcaligenes endophyticus]
MSSDAAAELIFTAEELDLLGNTADAMTAFMGKPVLAEVVDAEETGFEWVIFGIPLDVNDDAEQFTIVQLGGQSARLLGNRGGLADDDHEIYDCQCLWMIQLSPLEGVRYIKVDDEGDEVGWTDTLGEILPFEVQEPILDEREEDDEDTDDEPPMCALPGSPTHH